MSPAGMVMSYGRREAETAIAEIDKASVYAIKPK
jgi:hypothetical protein